MELEALALDTGGVRRSKLSVLRDGCGEEMAEDTCSKKGVMCEHSRSAYSGGLVQS